jgi:UDP-2,3-diacylglucosamine pyrophosphatase LpxH
MSDIRYVCISDLHLGADNSLLTRLGSQIGEVDAYQPSEVLLALVNCLLELVRHNQAPVKPTLILNGDLLEFALAEDNVALMVFERFVELLFPVAGEHLFDPKIIFNPGNHDHHLWETARETQYVEFLQGKRSKKPHGELPVPWHTTRMFHPDLVDSHLLDAVIRRHSHLNERGVEVGTVYPNFGLLNRDETKCLVFSHGHFVESIYMLMTTLGDFVFPKRIVPKEIWAIETENFAWIDFFWSAMGRSGAVGKDIEQVYDMLLLPETRKHLIRQLARASGRLWLPPWPKFGGWCALLFASFISNRFKHFEALEKRKPLEVLSEDAKRGLKAYIEGPLATQISQERNKALPAQTTFVFGHTHKPFSASIKFDPFPNPINVYNSGGWVVDTSNTEPAHGGAIVVADEELNVVSVRMYNESHNQERPQVKVEALDAPSNALYQQVSSLVKSDQDPWLSFSKVVAKDIDTYHQRFRERLNIVG